MNISFININNLAPSREGGIAIFAAYLAGRTLTPGADYLAVSRMAGTTAFLAYGPAQAIDSIWKGQASVPRLVRTAPTPPRDETW